MVMEAPKTADNEELRELKSQVSSLEAFVKDQFMQMTQ